MSDFQNEFGIDRGENKSKIQPTNKVRKDIPSNSIAGYNENELKEWLEKNGERILKDYYHRGFNTFSISGGTKLPKHDESEYQVATKSGQGVVFTNTGNCKILGNASVEVISNGKKNAGAGFNKKGDAGIVIYSKDGVIHIETLHGDITIRSSDNVNIEAGNNINIVAKNNINVDCVNYKKIATGNSSDIAEEKTLIHSGEELTLHCDTDNVQTSTGFDEELAGKDLRENIVNDYENIDKISNSGGG